MGTEDNPSGVHRSAGVFPLSLSKEEAEACEKNTFTRMSLAMLGLIASIAPSIRLASCFWTRPPIGTKVEAKLIDGNLWLAQEQIVSLYNSSKSNISEHIKHILEEGELDGISVVRNFRTTASDGKQYNVKHYNLDMILAIGYRVRSNIGTNFRKWATSTLKEYVTKGFALNDEMLKEAGGGRYFKELLRVMNSDNISESQYRRW